MGMKCGSNAIGWNDFDSNFRTIGKKKGITTIRDEERR
jgi:hypothetical protein